MDIGHYWPIFFGYDTLHYKLCVNYLCFKEWNNMAGLCDYGTPIVFTDLLDYTRGTFSDLINRIHDIPLGVLHVSYVDC